MDREMFMSYPLILLVFESVVAYFFVLWVHSRRQYDGLGPFYALLGGITVIMSWVTDSGIRIEAAGITFMVGSTVFYTALLLGVFVVYVFDGPRSTRIAIYTIAGISIVTPLIASILLLQINMNDPAFIASIPAPSLRINTASVLTTIIDLFFLAMAWEFLGKKRWRINIWVRAYLTLLGVMWIDVLLFTTGAFYSTPNYWAILEGTLLSRLVISLFAYPFLYFYLIWQYRKKGAVIENRPVLTILNEILEVRSELSMAKQEIERRHRAESALRKSENRYRTFINASDDMAYLKDDQLRYIIVNEKNAAFFNLNAEAIIGHDDFHLMPHEQALACRKSDEQALSEKKVVITEEIVDGRVYETRKFPVDIADDRIGIGAFIRDITERKRVEEKIQSLLAEKELLLKETHHRIKNNMNIIYGFLVIQAERTTDIPVKNVLHDAAARVESMMILYDKLFCSEDIQQLSIKEYFPVLIDGIIAIYPVHSKVKIDMELEDIILDVRRLSSLGIILSEMITNAMKYAFIGRHEGVVTITAANNTENIRIVFQDNGVGLADSITFENSSGFGMQLIYLLVQQLNGSIQIERNAGTTFIMHFPV